MRKMRARRRPVSDSQKKLNKRKRELRLGRSKQKGRRLKPGDRGYKTMMRDKQARLLKRLGVY